MDLHFSDVAPYLSSVFTAVIGWCAGRRKKDNDFLNDLQESINMLTDRNRELLKELVELRRENATLIHNQEEMKLKIEKLQRENVELRQEVELLNQKLSNVKTITRKA